MTRFGLAAIAIASASASVFAAPAAAQESMARFEVDGVRYSVPAPKGYCPTGPAVDAYMKMQRGVGAMPDAVFMPCDAKEVVFDFFAVAVPRGGARMERGPLLAELRRSMPALQRGPGLALEAGEDLGKRLSEALDTDVKVNVGVRAVSVDDFCGYIAGAVGFSIASGEDVTVTLVGCATAIDGRVTYVFRYVPGTDGARAAALLPQVKALAQSVRTGP